MAFSLVGTFLNESSATPVVFFPPSLAHFLPLDHRVAIFITLMNLTLVVESSLNSHASSPVYSCPTHISSYQSRSESKECCQE